MRIYLLSISECDEQEMYFIPTADIVDIEEENRSCCLCVRRCRDETNAKWMRCDESERVVKHGYVIVHYKLLPRRVPSSSPFNLSIFVLLQILVNFKL